MAMQCLFEPGGGSLGRQRLDLYASAGEAGEALEAWLARKVRRGYAPVVSNVKF
jgi:hypothetical protein